MQDYALDRRKGDEATNSDPLRGALIGSDPAFLDVLRLIPAVAGADHPVLITGETGTGKELVARTLHSLSSRSDAHFVPVNCGALPGTLFEDEIFGHEKGAFTDARARRPGLISRARGGILFLDEVDSLCPRGQVSLLRVLQDGRFRPLGSDTEQHVDVRFIAATNARIEELVDDGVFRADLHFRLNVLPLAVPPLRARRGDILPLARHFLHKHARDDGRHPELSSCATAALLAYDWPGNVRELESAIIRALHLSPSPHIQPADFHLPVRTDGKPNGRPALTNGGPARTCEPSFQELKQDVLSAFERDYLHQLLARHNGNVTRAARAAGKERRALGKLLRKHHIDPNEFSAAS